MIFVCYHFRALKAITLIFVLVNMKCKKVPLDSQKPYRITLQKLAHFAFSMQNRIHYFRWTAGLIVVTNSFLTGTKNDKVGSSLPLHRNHKSGKFYSFQKDKRRSMFISLVYLSALIHLHALCIQLRYCNNIAEKLNWKAHNMRRFRAHRRSFEIKLTKCRVSE